MSEGAPPGAGSPEGDEGAVGISAGEQDRAESAVGDGAQQRSVGRSANVASSSLGEPGARRRHRRRGGHRPPQPAPPAGPGGRRPRRACAGWRRRRRRRRPRPAAAGRRRGPDRARASAASRYADVSLGEVAAKAVQLALLVASDSERWVRRVRQALGRPAPPRRSRPPTRRAPAGACDRWTRHCPRKGTRSGSDEHHSCNAPVHSAARRMSNASTHASMTAQ